MIGLAAPLAAERPPLPEGVRLREVTARADLDRIAAMEEAVWGEDRSHLADEPGEGDRGRSRGHDGRRRRGRLLGRGSRHGRQRRLGPLRARHRVRDAVGRLDAEGVARARDLPSAGGVSRLARREPWPHPPRGRRLRRQPTDPAAVGLRRGHDDDAVRLHTTTSRLSTANAATSSAMTAGARPDRGGAHPTQCGDPAMGDGQDRQPDTGQEGQGSQGRPRWCGR